MALTEAKSWKQLEALEQTPPIYGCNQREQMEGMILAVIMASLRKVRAGLRYAASGQYQDYPPGILELGVALDALNMVAADVVACIQANEDDDFGGCNYDSD